MLAPITHTPSQQMPLADQAVSARRDQAMRQAANDLEANFLAEMLKSAGLGKPRETMGGGAGEDQFASFLRMEQAKAMVQAGGIGLSEAFFNALKERDNDR